jgi:hypothetical protein
LADDDDAEPTAAAESDGDETAIDSNVGLTEAIDTAAAPSGSEPDRVHAWSLDEHSEEPGMESKWPARLRWAGLVALLCATVAAAVWFSMVFYFGSRSMPKPSTQPSASRTDAPPTGATAAVPSLQGTFPASAVDTVLLTPVEINTLVSSSDPLLQIKQTTYGARNDANLRAHSAALQAGDGGPATIRAAGAVPGP